MHVPGPRWSLAALAVVLVSACGGGSSATDAERGVALYRANCAQCHGVEMEGTNVGPPLVHELYGPSNYDDAWFQRAVAEGADAALWDFGPMPAVGSLAGLTEDEVADILAHVRELQRAAGID